MSTKRRLVIASSLTELQNERLSALESQPKVIPLAVTWRIPAGAAALFTYPTAPSTVEIYAATRALQGGFASERLVSNGRDFCHVYAARRS